MAEVGVEISKPRAKPLADVRDIPFDYVVTLCGNAHQPCSAFPGETKIRHIWPALPVRRSHITHDHPRKEG